MKKFIFKSFIDKHYVLKESLVATFFTIIVTFLVSFIPIKYEFSKAIRIDFLGFDIYDLYFSGKELPNGKRDPNIVIVGLANDRETIARQVEVIQKYSPTAIGIDAKFEKRDDTTGNEMLSRIICQGGNVVTGTELVKAGNKRVLVGHNFFENGDCHDRAGFMNLFEDSFATVRTYRPFYKSNDSTYLSFSSAILKKSSPENYERLRSRNKSVEIINYCGSMASFTCLPEEQFWYNENTDQLKSILEGKIVLLGYFVSGPGNPLVLSDLWYSPVNKRIAGKSLPDMYGVVTQANILAMTLSGRYMRQTSYFVSYLYASLIIFLFLYYMLSEYRKKPHPKHGKFLLIQFLLVLVVLFIFLLFFNWFWVKVPLLPIMIALVLCVELLGVYKNVALWMHKKYGFRTVFAHKHII